MARASDRGKKDAEKPEHNDAKGGIQEDLDALFKLPLTSFTVERNALATRLKKAGRSDDAERVKSIAKPSVSVWAANQRYWQHQDAFNRLVATGERFVRAQASQFAGKAADLRGPLAERREALSALALAAETLLHEAGHNATPDTMRRI